MNMPGQILRVVFFRTETGNEPVRAWLHEMSKEAKRIIGEDIKTVQFGWPLGMPLVRKLEARLWEVRSNIPDGIARVLFTIIDNDMILLHAFKKKSQKTPTQDLSLARFRLKQLM
jgi:phage-related protein